MSFQDPNNPPYDPTQDPTLGGGGLYSIDHQDVDNQINNEMGTFDPGSAVGAAAVDIGTDTTQNKTTGGVPGLNTEPVGGSAPPGPNNLPEPSVTAAQQGAPGFGAGASDRPTLPAGGGGQPQGTHEFLGAGPGYEIGGGYSGGMMFNDNMPTSTKLNMGWQPGGYIGKDTIVPGGATNLSYGSEFGAFGNGIGLNGRPIDTSGFGTHGISGGLFGPYEAAGGGGLAPIGPGVNMGGKATGFDGQARQQMIYNAELGQAPLGGGGVNGPGLAFYDPRTGQPVTGRTLPAGAAAGTDTVLGTRPNLPAGAGGTAGAAAAGNYLQDQGHVIYNADGSIRGVASPNGYYDPSFQSEANILRNAELIGDPAAIRDLPILARAGDKNAAAELGTIEGLPDFARSQLAARGATLHNQQIESRIPTEFAGNTAAAANLRSQMQANIPSNPVSNFDALLGGDAHAQAVDLLHGMGASNVKIAPGANGLELSWTSKSGNQNTIPFDMNNSSALVAALQGDPDAKAYIASQNRGGNAPRGGGGGGNRPQTAAQQDAGNFENTLFQGRGNFGEGGLPDVAAQPTYKGNVYSPAGGYPIGGRETSGLPY